MTGSLGEGDNQKTLWKRHKCSVLTLLLRNAVGSFDRPMNQPSPTFGDGRRADLLSPRELAQLGGLEFVARGIVDGFLLGLHRSPNRGFSAEFAEHRAYQPGDDLRFLDWRMFARSDRFYIKQFQEETNLRAYLLLDVSKSMDWSSAQDLPSKLWFGRQLAAALALILTRQGDAVGLSIFHDEIVHSVAAKGGRRQWYDILRRLSSFESQGGTAAPRALRAVARRLAKPGLVILISDLLVDPEETSRTLRHLRHRGNEVMVFHVIDPGEMELPAAGEARFLDPETGEEVRVNAAHLREAYREAVDEAMADWIRTLKPHGIDYAALSTDQPFTTALRHFFSKRAKLG